MSCQGYLGTIVNNQKIRSDIDFVQFLLEDAKVALVPGSAFGKSPFFRISYATSLEDLKEACLRIDNSLSKLKKMNILVYGVGGWRFYWFSNIKL